MNEPQPDDTPPLGNETDEVETHSRDSINLFEDVVVKIDPRPMREVIRRGPPWIPPPPQPPTESGKT
jgi:hypothetical protein